MTGGLLLDLTVRLPGWVPEIATAGLRLRGDEERMRLVIRLARENVEREPGGGPFAAGLFREDTNELVSVGLNSVLRLRNSVLHAEVMAIMLAEGALGLPAFNLPEAPPVALVASCDPCVMCLGATLWSGVGRLVCGASKADAEGIGFDEGPVTDDSYLYLERRGVVIARGVLREEARRVLQRYRELDRPIY